MSPEDHLPARVDAEVARDRVDPRAHLRAALELRGSLDDAQEHFLEQLLRAVLVPDRAKDEVEQRSLEATHQGLERVRVPLDELPEERLVRRPVARIHHHGKDPPFSGARCCANCSRTIRRSSRRVGLTRWGFGAGTSTGAIVAIPTWFYRFPGESASA